MRQRDIRKRTTEKLTPRHLAADAGGHAVASPRGVELNMAEGKLQENMLVEVSPNWDGRNKKVTYMEAFGRLMAGIAPWLALPDDDTEEGKMRRQLRELRAIPISPGFLMRCSALTR